MKTQSDNWDELAPLVIGKGISVDMPQIPWPGGDMALVESIVRHLNVFASLNPKLEFAWKVMNERTPSRFLFLSEYPLGYYAIGVIVTGAQLELKHP